MLIIKLLSLLLLVKYISCLNILQVNRDEFNTSETFFNSDLNLDNKTPILNSLRQILLRQNYSTCCQSWKNLTSNKEIQDELKRLHGRSKIMLKPSDLLHELKKISSNITYLSIDGQNAGNERDNYYIFYDSVNYYLRLLKVAGNFVEESENRNLDGQEIDFLRNFKRQLVTIMFRVDHDTTLNSFINELLASQDEQIFGYYENFLSQTQFGQNYAHNISLIRESVLVFNQICSHLTSTQFPSNFTRPSKQYEMIKRMSQELYHIRKELSEKINARIRNNRRDSRGLFERLTELEQSRPYIKMLGDTFSLVPYNYGEYVKKMTELLDLYLSNNLTRVSFYEKLVDLPEDFIVLAINIATDYEHKEVPQQNRFFEVDYYNWLQPSSVYKVSDNANSTNKIEPAEKRQSNLSLLRRLFS